MKIRATPIGVLTVVRYTRRGRTYEHRFGDGTPLLAVAGGRWIIAPARVAKGQIHTRSTIGRLGAVCGSRSGPARKQKGRR